jgi:hypothetical protein
MLSEPSVNETYTASAVLSDAAVDDQYAASGTMAMQRTSLHSNLSRCA